VSWIVEALCGAVAIGTAGWWVRRRLVLVAVTGRSMEPTLWPGDRVLVRRVAGRSVRPGHLAVLRWPVRADEPPVPGRDWMVKRVVAVAGDPVPGRAGQRVPPGSLVVLGDNPAVSHDSRQLGYLDDDLLLGVVVHRFGSSGVAGSGRHPGGPACPGDLAGPAAVPAAAGRTGPDSRPDTREDRRW
jgi:signal peptidase I